MSLTGKTKASSYKDILQVDNSNNGIGTTLRAIKDGEGTSSCLKLSDDILFVQPVNDDTVATFAVINKAGGGILNVDTTNSTVKAGAGQYFVNTQIQKFGIGMATARPSTADTWSALSTDVDLISEVTAGTGSSPATTLTIDGSTIIASSAVAVYWHVPFNITLDSCTVLYGADADNGDSVKFSLMSYTIDTANGSTGGDLSSGVELCVSGAISGSGDEQVYYDTLTIANDDVNAGKVICAFINSDGTNSDYSVNMQLVYHLR